MQEGRKYHLCLVRANFLLLFADFLVNFQGILSQALRFFDLRGVEGRKEGTLRKQVEKEGRKAEEKV
jgi:hypothetical protein